VFTQLKHIALDSYDRPHARSNHSMIGSATCKWLVRRMSLEMWNYDLRHTG
jgi:hypothetical protein